MNDVQFIYKILVLAVSFILAMTFLIMAFILIKKRIRYDKCYEALNDLETTINNLSRDATVNQQYVYRLGQCLRIIRGYLE